MSRSPTLAATAAGVGLLFFLWSLRAPGPIGDQHSFRWAGIAVLVVLIFRFTGPVVRLIEPLPTLRLIWLVLLCVAVALGIVSGHRRMIRSLSILLATLAVVTLTFGMTVAEWRSDIGLDVYWMHRQAGDALLAGENPYTDVVRVSNGSPFAPEGSVIEGYPYPPVVAGTYGLTGASLEPRLVSGVAWLAVIAWFAVRSLRKGIEGDKAYAMFLLVAGLAVWPVVWFASWTEPLSVALLMLTAIWWRKRPGLSAVFLGLALASKQYFIFLLPLLLLHKDEHRGMRVGTSVGVAGATILIGLLPDPDSFVTATLLNLTEIGNRPDTQSLSGLLYANGIEFYLGSFVWIALGLMLATLLAWRSRSPADFMGRAGVSLGLVFFFGQAFSNYWFLVLALMAVATVVAAETGSEVEGVEERLPADAVRSRWAIFRT